MKKFYFKFYFDSVFIMLVKKFFVLGGIFLFYLNVFYIFFRYICENNWCYSGCGMLFDVIEIKCKK